MKKKILALLLAAAMVLEGTGILTVQAAITNSSMDTAIEMTLDTECYVEVEEGEVAYHKFIPEESGNYIFKGVVTDYESGYSDTYAELLDEEGMIIASNDDYYDYNQFGINCKLEEGKTYYLKSNVYNTAAGSYTMVVNKMTFIAYAEESNVEIPYGSSATLHIIADSERGNVTYRWYYCDEDGNEVDVSGATSSSLTVKGQKGTADSYYCFVTDGTDSATIGFNIDIDTGLCVDESSNSNVKVEYGKTAVLSANTVGGLGSLTYKWYYYDEYGESVLISGATSKNYTVKGDTTLKKEYECIVSDGIKNVSCWFYTSIDTGLVLERTDYYINMLYGNTKTLVARAAGGVGTLTYKWYYYDDEIDEYIEIQAVTGNTYTVTANENVYEEYKCVVSDSMNSCECRFYIQVDTGWYIESGGSSQYIPSGMTKTLSVTTTETDRIIDYQWYYFQDGWKIAIEGATENTYDVLADANAYDNYICEVSDGIKTINVDFSIYTAPLTDWSVESDYETTDEFSFYKLTSENTKAYRFYTVGEGADTYAVLLDSDLNMIASNEANDDENFSLTHILNSGEEYYLFIRRWNENGFTFKSEEVGFAAIARGDSTVSVKYGESRTLEVEAIADNENLDYQWYSYNEDTDNYEIIQGATNSTYTFVANADASNEYRCIVSNGTDQINVQFYVEIDTGLKVSVNTGNETIVVPYGKNETVTVTATSNVGNVKYQWSYWDDDRCDYIDISGATGNSIVLKGDANLSTEYRCVVSDGVVKDWVYINVELDSGLILYDSNYESISMEFGDSKTLRITATSTNGTIKYQWYYWDDIKQEYIAIKGATSNKFELLADINAKSDYKCVVTDGLSTKYRSYYIEYTGAIADMTEMCTVTPSYSTVEYDGKAKTPAVTVKHGSQVLVKDEHYTVSYQNNTNVGTATIIVKGRGKYTGTIKKTFAITKKSIAKSTVTLSKKTYIYDGKAKKPTVKVTLGGKTLVNGTDYTVSYKNNKKIGTATVTITGKGNYSGAVKATYKINIKVGKTYTVGAYKYKVTSKSEVAFAGLKKANTKKVVIAASVKIGGKKFKITSVTDKALQKKTKVTNVTVGANVKKIGKNAFNGCKNLKNITIKSTNLKSVGKNALKGINAKAKIKVPSKKLKAYNKLLKGKGQAKTVRITK